MQVLDAPADAMIRRKNDGSLLRSLHLDSLNEVLLRIDLFANLVASELLNFPVERLSIQIACRTAIEPADTLGRAIERVWDEQAGTPNSPWVFSMRGASAALVTTRRPHASIS